MSNLMSSQINTSRDVIREQISDYVKSYLELEGVDLTKSSFLTFLINVISTLTGNLMFYQTSVYNEFFLTKSQFPESVFNLSAFLGYQSYEASYSSVNVLITMPLGFSDSSAVFTIPEGFKFKTKDNIEFITYYKTTITVTNNSSLTILIEDGNKKYYLPSTNPPGTSDVNFILPLRQYKEIIQEFQIDADLEQYQFVTKDIPIADKVSSMTIEFREPNDSSWTTWTEYSSLYLLNESIKGYVARRTDTGKKLYFGNGLIGIQPTPGSTLKATINVTKGVEGNVIAGSINSGERIYVVTSAGATQIVDYSVINPSPAINGKDEESIEEIRNNAIASITTLKRLVTEDDYKNINVVIPNSPLSSNSIAVLKRSDVKVNDIQIYTPVEFGNELVPTRNAKLTIPLATTYIPRNTEITIDDIVYYTIFDMTINLLNSVANYEYIMYQIEQIPSLVTSYNSLYNIIANNFIVSKEDNKAIFTLHYASEESDSDQCTCEMQIASTGSVYEMTNDSTSSDFTLEFDPYTLLPQENELYYFTISDPSDLETGKYSVEFIFRKSLHDFMLSNTVSDSTSTIIYDIPVVQKDYYDEIDQNIFESQVLQVMMSSMSLADTRMLTDFTNVKFTNTTGYCKNMLYNPINRESVLDIVESVPTNPSINDRYIVTEEGDYKNNIYECIDSTTPIWTQTIPATDDILYVDSQSEKYIYSNLGWVQLSYYSIPLEFEIEVFKESTYSGSNIELSNLIRTSLVEAFESRFGSNISIYRSEIIDIVQTIEGVNHCRLLKPETNIFFNFELTDLIENELLEYGPEYIFFKEENITIRIHL